MGKEVSDIIFALCLLLNAGIFVPQALEIYRHKNTENVSLVTFLGFNLVQVLSVINGIFYDDPILIIGSLLAIVTCGSVSCLIVYYRSNTVSV